MNTKTCAHCGSEFQAGRKTKKYCKEGCRTMASNKKNGFKVGRIPIGEKAKDLTFENVPQKFLPGMNGIENERIDIDITAGGTLESFLGAGLAGVITNLITQGEYDEKIINLQKSLNYIIHLLETLLGVQKPKSQVKNGIPIPPIQKQKIGMPTIPKINFPSEPMM
jgi:hypothetical protein